MRDLQHCSRERMTSRDKPATSGQQLDSKKHNRKALRLISRLKGFIERIRMRDITLHELRLEFHGCTRIHFSRSEPSTIELITQTLSS